MGLELEEVAEVRGVVRAAERVVGSAAGSAAAKEGGSAAAKAAAKEVRPMRNLPQPILPYTCS